jgi:hypothetical protein
MWLTVLKYVAKGAVALGLHEKLGEWIKRRVTARVDKLVALSDKAANEEMVIYNIVKGEEPYPSIDDEPF